MQAKATGKAIYLYLNGMGIEKELVLTEHLSLLPANPSVSADLCSSLGENALEAAVITIFLPVVQSQFCVHGLEGRDAATVAWNATWDAFFIGAVVGCEAMNNLQSDVPVESLDVDATVRVTNYQFRGFPKSKPHSISEDESVWVKQHFEAARKLNEDDRYRNAIHSLASYRWHSMPRVQLAILWSGIEGLFAVDSELVFRISLYIAVFLEPDKRDKQKELFAAVKDLYKLRSKAVHGGQIKQDLRETVEKSAEILRLLVRRCTENARLPEVSGLVP